MAFVLFIDDRKDGSISVSQDIRKSCIQRAKESKRCYILEAVDDTRRGVIGTAMTPWSWYQLDDSKYNIRMKMSYHYNDTPSFKTLELNLNSRDKFRTQIPNFLNSLLYVNDFNQEIGTDRIVDIEKVEIISKQSNLAIDASNASIKDILRVTNLGICNYDAVKLLQKKLSNSSTRFHLSSIIDQPGKKMDVISFTELVYLPSLNTFYFIPTNLYEFLSKVKDFEISFFRDMYTEVKLSALFTKSCDSVERILEACYIIPMIYYLDSIFFENSMSTLISFWYEGTYYEISISSVVPHRKINLLDQIITIMEDVQHEIEN